MGSLGNSFERSAAAPPLSSAEKLRCTAVGSAAFVANHAGVFERIFADDVSICVWDRPVDPLLERYLLDSVSSSVGWELRGCVEGQAPQLDEILGSFENDLGRVRVRTELMGLIDLFVTLTEAQTVGIRLTATRGAMCPRFHADQVDLRLLCTWVGEGTEWLAEEDIIRDTRGATFSSPVGPMRPGASIQQLGPFAVGVFKGNGWPGNEGRGAVHRSPQPEGWRVFVSLDAL
jgi:hypothetical protein